MKRALISAALTSLVLFPFAVVKAEQPTLPQIEGHGAVTQFPWAKGQPRDGSRIVVDLTAGGARASINPGVEKLARFVNVYAAAGRSPARVEIVAVLHGNATQIALNDEAYAAAFGVKSNPNLPLMRKLRRAGVGFLVCGQDLTHKGYNSTQTAREVDLSVSGSTAIVNLQQDGYAFIPVN